MEVLSPLLDGRSFLELALVVFAFVVLPGMSFYFGLSSRKSGPPKNLIGRYLQTMVRGWILAAAVIFAWQVSGRAFAGLGLGWPPGPTALFAIGFSLLAVLVLLFQVTFGFRPSKEDLKKWKGQLDALKLAPRNGGELSVFLAVAVTAGVWEELFYRGFLMWFFEPLAGVWGGVVVTALIFGAGHAYQGLKGVARTCLVGLFFGAGYALTESLWWLMILHAAVDIFAGVLALRVYSMSRVNRN
jgi:membrane protease YdiL (CAAX protease family)